MIVTNHFTNRESGQVIRVEKVTEHFASITVVNKLISTYSYPVALYDTEFVKQYKPLDIGDVKVPAEFRPPANASVWDEGAPPVEVHAVVDAVQVPTVESLLDARMPAQTVVEADEDEADDGAAVGYGYQQPR